MASFKNIIFILSTLAIFGLNIVSGGPFDIQSHHLTIGARYPNDRFLQTFKFEKKSHFLDTLNVTQVFHVPDVYQNYLITQVKAIDKHKNGEGAYIDHVQYGPGFNRVVLRFVSKKGGAINFWIEMFGIPRY